MAQRAQEAFRKITRKCNRNLLRNPLLKITAFIELTAFRVGNVQLSFHVEQCVADNYIDVPSLISLKVKELYITHQSFPPTGSCQSE